MWIASHLKHWVTETVHRIGTRVDIAEFCGAAKSDRSDSAA
jgi:hypothetical protein